MSPPGWLPRDLLTPWQTIPRREISAFPGRPPSGIACPVTRSLDGGWPRRRNSHPALRARSSVGRALPLHGRSHGFESCRAHHLPRQSAFRLRALRPTTVSDCASTAPQLPPAKIFDRAVENFERRKYSNAFNNKDFCAMRYRARFTDPLGVNEMLYH